LAKNHNLLPGFVDGRDPKLIPGEINDHGICLSVGWESYRFPVNRDLAIPNAEEAAKIDNGGADLSRFVGNDVDDPAHVIPGGAANLFAEDALDLLAV
jgi:hypothetical protein